MINVQKRDADLNFVFKPSFYLDTNLTHPRLQEMDRRLIQKTNDFNFRTRKC